MRGNHTDTRVTSAQSLGGRTRVNADKDRSGWEENTLLDPLAWSAPSTTHAAVGVTSRRSEPTMTIALRQDFVLRRLHGSVTYQVTPVSPESANARMPRDMRSLL